MYFLLEIVHFRQSKQKCQNWIENCLIQEIKAKSWKFCCIFLSNQNRKNLIGLEMVYIKKSKLTFLKFHCKC